MRLSLSIEADGFRKRHVFPIQASYFLAVRPHCSAPVSMGESAFVFCNLQPFGTIDQHKGSGDMDRKVTSVKKSESASP